MSARPILAFLAAAVLFAAAPAEARTFYVVRSGANAWTVMDADSIERILDTSVLRAWSVTVQRNILSAGQPPQPGYVRTLNEYDCDAHRTRWITFSAFSRGGGLLMTRENPAPDWGPSEEADDVKAGYRVVCEGVGGGAVVAADSLAKVVISLMSAWDEPAQPVPPPAAKAPVVKPGPAAPQKKK
jgi:hypothetical protein